MFANNQDPAGIISRILMGGQGQVPGMMPSPIAPGMTGAPAQAPVATNRKTGPLDAIFARQK